MHNRFAINKGREMQDTSFLCLFFPHKDGWHGSLMDGTNCFWLYFQIKLYASPRWQWLPREKHFILI